MENNKIIVKDKKGEKIGEIKKVNELTKPIVDEKKDVFFFGEGNFTLPLALAALRGNSWDGITVSFYESDTPYNIKSTTDDVGGVDLTKVKVIAKKGIPPSSQQAIDEVPNFSQYKPTIYYNADVTKLGPWGFHEGVFWFQCPWAYEQGNDDKILELLQEFMQKTGVQLLKDSYLLIGITTHQDYVERYKLDKLGIFNWPQGQYGFNFIGGDTRLINTLIQYGYHHEAHKVNIHDYIKNDHITLVFRRC